MSSRRCVVALSRIARSAATRGACASPDGRGADARGIACGWFGVVCVQSSRKRHVPTLAASRPRVMWHVRRYGVT